MNIIVFGASGRTGKEIVMQALGKGYEVTAFIRPTSNFQLQHQHLKIIKGQLTDVEDMAQAIRGHDVVVSALGASNPMKYDSSVVEGFANLCTATNEAGVNRLIYMSPLAVKQHRQAAGFFIHYLAPRLIPTEIKGHEEREKILRNSELDWLIVQAPLLTLGPHTGIFRIGEDIRGRGFFVKLSRADVADAIVQQFENHNGKRKSIRVMP